MSAVRVLALDHYFDQDLRALEGQSRLEVRRFPFRRLRSPAMHMMGSEVGRGLRAYNDPERAAGRARYAAWLVGEVRRLYLEWQFDVIVLPSDTFFYVRALPAAAHRLGIPVMVVQKETTISRATMESFSKDIRVEAPFLSDFMTVCSERQREFWIRAGAAADRIEVTGQPRFDLYASSVDTHAASRRRVLFTSYALDAYVPGAGRGKGLRTWAPLRDATERTLLELVRAGRCDLVVKCHPQQDRRAEAARLARLAGPDWNRGVTIAEQDADTRQLIIASDVVVGFQTTTLYEAVAARREVVYAAWGEAYERYRGELIAFDQAPRECVRHAQSSAMLMSILGEPAVAVEQGCVTWTEDALGVLDGHAADRVAARIESVAGAWSATHERRGLDRRRRSYAVGFLVRSLAAEAVWAAATPAARFTGEAPRVAIRRQSATEGRSIAARTLLGRPRKRGH
jgi:hypothetical protein